MAAAIRQHGPIGNNTAVRSRLCCTSWRSVEHALLVQHLVGLRPQRGKAQRHVSGIAPLNGAHMLDCVLTMQMSIVHPGNRLCECTNASFVFDLCVRVWNESCAFTLGAAGLRAMRTQLMCGLIMHLDDEKCTVQSLPGPQSASHAFCSRSPRTRWSPFLHPHW